MDPRPSADPGHLPDRLFGCGHPAAGQGHRAVRVHHQADQQARAAGQYRDRPVPEPARKGPGGERGPVRGRGAAERGGYLSGRRGRPARHRGQPGHAAVARVRRRRDGRIDPVRHRGQGRGSDRPEDPGDLEAGEQVYRGEPLPPQERRSGGGGGERQQDLLRRFGGDVRGFARHHRAQAGRSGPAGGRGRVGGTAGVEHAFGPAAFPGRDGRGHRPRTQPAAGGGARPGRAFAAQPGAGLGAERGKAERAARSDHRAGRPHGAHHQPRAHVLARGGQERPLAGADQRGGDCGYGSAPGAVPLARAGADRRVGR